MTSYNSQSGQGEFLIQLYTNDRRLYEIVQDIIRMAMDKERFEGYYREDGKYLVQGGYNR